MCGSAPKNDNSAVVAQQQAEAEEARAREEQRQARLAAGTASIRRAFAGYDDAYFGRTREAFIGANRPALDDQQEQDTRNLFFGLARSGNQNSSTANDQRARLAKGFATQDGALLGAADDAVANRRSDVANTRMGLETQLRATEDADLAAGNATAQARALDRTPAATAGTWLTPLVQTTALGAQAYGQGVRQGKDRAVYEPLIEDQISRLQSRAGSTGGGSARTIR